MFTRPPHGHSTAASVTVRPPAHTTITVVLISTATLAIAASAHLAGNFPSAPALVALGGLLGAATAAALGTGHYAAGPGWFRRGRRTVNLHELTTVAVIDRRVLLIDSRQRGQAARWYRPGRVTFPLQAATDHPDLFQALRAGMYGALTRRPVLVNPSAADAFSLDVSTVRG